MELPPVEASSAHDDVYARRALVAARRLRDEGRLDAALRTTARGLALHPDDPALHQLRAELLEARGRSEEAVAHWEQAASLAPPPPPETAANLSTDGLLVVLLPDDAGPAPAPPASDAAEDAARRALREQLAVRLPGAMVHAPVAPDPELASSVPALRRWLAARRAQRVLTLEIEGLYCGETSKDGRFAVARLRAAAGARGAPAAVVPVKDIRSALPASPRCREHAAARALELVLAADAIRTPLALGLGLGLDLGTLETLETGSDEPRFAGDALRALFPALDRRITAELEEGRRLVRSGRLEAAMRHFQAAQEADPEHEDAATLLAEAETALALSRELSTSERAVSSGAPASGDLAPRLSARERAMLEQQVQDAQRQREDLLAALDALDTDVEPPSESVLAALRPLDTADGWGAEFARERAGGEIAARALYAPDGAQLARYYFAATAHGRLQSDGMVVREEDSRGDGEPDRWVLFDAGTRREVWEATQGTPPELRMVYGGDGQTLERVELDGNGDGRADRVFRYRAGRVASEARDTNGDGRFDRVEHFDAGGSLELVEEDRNHDGQTDVRTAYRNGRLLRREFLDPEVAGPS